MSSAKGVAVVTGAAQGIGRAIALRLADDGFDVAVNDLPLPDKIAKLKEVEEEIIRKGRRSAIFPGDVSNDTDVKGMVEGTVNMLGGLDVMVANAAICRNANILDYTVDQWDQSFAVNARGCFLCYQYAAKQMVKQGRGGRIIGCSSSAGKQGLPMMSLYGATKSAIRGLTQGAALDLGKYGITVNAYAPGDCARVDTEMCRDAALQQGDMNELIKTNVSRSALDYIGQPEDIAGLVSYLASKESRYMTGMYLSFHLHIVLLLNG
ncbi:NAD-P-binding protein [Armillaria luteobubalina]|uniref:NAD-P-binding protein n=1 Tax=Armillaria luteobubalina TaxID=153913 RepID=A0AA39UL23_9AGAR|nr:NAD-P-binding protein [Armillaria luteobubalina]